MRAGRRGTAAGRFCAFAAEKRERGSRNGGREGGCAGEEAPRRSPGPLPEGTGGRRTRRVFCAGVSRRPPPHTRARAHRVSPHARTRAHTGWTSRSASHGRSSSRAFGDAGCVSGSPAGGEETTGKAPGPRPVSLRPPGGPPATCSRKLELAKAVANTRLPGPASISFAYLS